MKKFISMLLAIVMVFSLLPATVFAAENITISYEVENADNLAVGSEFSVTANLDTEIALASVKLMLTWNDKVVEFTGFNLEDDYIVADVFSARGWNVVTTEYGVITAAIVNNKTVKGTLFTANFKVIAGGNPNIGIVNSEDKTVFNMAALNDDGASFTTYRATMDDTAVKGLYAEGPVAGATIPEELADLGVAAMTTDNGDVMEYTLMSEYLSVDSGWIYQTAPYYLVTIPEGAENVYVTFDEDTSIVPTTINGVNWASTTVGQIEEMLPEDGEIYEPSYVDETGAMSAAPFQDEQKNIVKIPMVMYGLDFSTGNLTDERICVLKTADEEYGEYGSYYDEDYAHYYYVVGVQAHAGYDTPVIVYFAFVYGEEVEEEEVYNITIDNTIVGGTVWAADEDGNRITEAKAGETVCLNHEAYKCHTFAGFIYTPEGGSATEAGNGAFNMPASNVTITATFSESHTYGEHVNQEFIVAAATCQHGAQYYKSCDNCSKKGNETFTDEKQPAVACDYNENNVCRWCGTPKPNVITKIEISHPKIVKSEDGAMTMAMVSGVTEQIDLSSAVADAELTPTQMVWWSSSDETVATVDQNGKITALKAGTVTITAKAVEASGIALLADEEEVLAAVTLNVSDPEPGYTVNMGGDVETVTGETVSVPVTVGHTGNEVTSYNAFDFTFTYDPAYLQLTSTKIEGVTVTDNNGTVHVERYGTDLTVGDTALTLTFKPLKDGSSSVFVTAAKVDIAENADDKDAPDASIMDDITIVKVTGYTVQMPDGLNGETAVQPGVDYTFTVADPNYDYDFSGSTMGGQPVTVVANEDGTYTIKGVSGNIVLTYTKTAKTFDVTLGEDMTADQFGTDAAQYNTAYVATLTKEAGYGYSVTVTIGGTDYTSFEAKNNEDGTVTYTIPGAAITGDIVFDSGKKAGDYTVTVNGTAAGHVTYEGTAEGGKAYTFTLNKVAGYTYDISATMGGAAVTLQSVEENGAVTYTTPKVTGNIVITVNGTSDLTVAVKENYVTLNGKAVFLVTATQTLDEGKVLTYDGNVMFYSERYKAWAYLVIVDESLDADAAKANIAVTTGNKVTLNATTDVNGTEKTDINDAQLVYNMYNNEYQNFDKVTVEKFLKADQNNDKTVNVSDAAAIVTAIINAK